MAVTPDPNPKFNKMREKICNSTVELQCEEFCGGMINKIMCSTLCMSKNGLNINYC